MKNDNVKNKLSKYFSKEVLDNINFSEVNKNKDLISSIYEKIHNKEERKKYAQFFTHKELVNFILSNIPIKKTDFVLDPACGAGAFLIEAYEKVSLNNIYGIDIDKKALDLCSINLENKVGKSSFNLKQANTLKTNLKFIFPKIAKQGGFDIVIGNPPFQNLLKNIDYKEEEIYTKVLSGIANSATLMIAKGYEFLKEGGFMGFVLPKNIARVDSFKTLRKFLIENTKIMNIYDLDHYFKDVRGDQMIMIFRKKKLTSKEILKNKVKILIFRKGNKFTDPYNYEIPQTLFNQYNFFPIFYHENIFKLANKLLSEKNTLEKLCEGKIFRGLGISTKSDSFVTEKINNACISYRGDSIKRFGIKYQLFLKQNIVDKLPKNEIKRLNVEKIILQNLCSKEGGIFATICSGNEFTLDTVTNIITNKIELKYLLGVLNSKLANFFLIFIIFLNSNFTMHTDKQYIGKIPIMLPNKKQENKVISIVDRIMKIKDNYSKEFFELYDKLNNHIFEIYHLDKKEIDIINKLLLEVMSKKQNGISNE